MSAKFKAGQKVKALNSTLDIKAGEVYEVIADDFANFPTVRDAAGDANGMLSRDSWELVRAFKAGDIVRTDDSFLRGMARTNGADPDRSVVRKVDERGYPILEWERVTETAGFDPALFEFVKPTGPFAVGDVVTPNKGNTSPRTFTSGREYTVTRTRKRGNGGYAIYLDADDDGNTSRFRPHEEFDLVRKAGEPAPVVEPAPYYLVSSPVQKFDTPHATKEAAKEWITEYGTPGVEYKLHRVYDEGTFSVVRELKEAA
jgi:hypothetical protein